MKFRLANREKELILNALFPEFSERLQVACLNSSPLHSDSVWVTSHDDVNDGMFIDDDYLVSIRWGEGGGIDIIFEPGDAFRTGAPENLPDETSVWCEYGPLGDRDTQRFYADIVNGHVVRVHDYFSSAAFNWRRENPDKPHPATPVACDRFMTEADLAKAIKAERRRRGMKTFD